MEHNNKLNEMAKKDQVDKETLETLVILLAPFAPHISEEIVSGIRSYRVCIYSKVARIR